MKTMFITFFDIKSIAHSALIPQEQIVNQSHYVKTMKQLHKAVCRRRPELWLNK